MTELAEGARLEIVCAPKAYLGFESPSLRQFTFKAGYAGFFIIIKRRGGRAAECGGLENRFTDYLGDEGSNPSSSASTPSVFKDILMNTESVDTTLEEFDPRDVIQKLVAFSLTSAKDTLQGEGELAPFTVLAAGENIFVETHPGETIEECFAAAQEMVMGAQGAFAYVLCYDGFVEGEDEDTDSDAIIAEAGLVGEPDGFAAALLYEFQEDKPLRFDENFIDLGPAPNYMAGLIEPTAEDVEQLISRLSD